MRPATPMDAPNQMWIQEIEALAVGRPVSDRDLVLERAIDICIGIANDPDTQTMDGVDVMQRMLDHLRSLRAQARIEYLQEVAAKLGKSSDS